MSEERAEARRGGVLDEEMRRVAAATVAAAAIGWWPAFTLGTYGVVFFEQSLALWAAATSAFFAAGLARGRRFWRRPSSWTLRLPSLWIVLAWTLPVGGLGTQHPRLLTCEDFTISGNFAPENCSPGTGSTVR